MDRTRPALAFRTPSLLRLGLAVVLVAALLGVGRLAVGRMADRTGPDSPGRGAGQLTGGTPATSTATHGALPPCAYGDVVAELDGYVDWASTILDTTYRLPSDYVPPDLVAIKDPEGGSGRVRAFVRAPLVELLSAARRSGETITVASAYRSYAQQVGVFDSLETAYGRDFALLSAARPGHSEHQLGTAVDFEGGDDWLAGNAWRYGFARSYPPDRSPERTCYKFEPWHFRYVGVDRAAAIHASGLSPREWLWRNTGG